MRLAILCFVSAFTLAGITGCGSRPPRAAAPDWSPSDMAQAAITQLDASGDSVIDRKEVAASPGLLDAFETLDADGSDSLSAAEIEERFKLYDKLKTAFVKTTIQVKLNGRPLNGVLVKLIPEDFQGDALSPAVGTTNQVGQVSPRTEGKSFPAMQPGFYRVELYEDEAASKPIEVKTPLGLESSPQSRRDRNLLIVLNYEGKRPQSLR